MKDILRKLYGRIYNRYSFCTYLEIEYLKLRKKLVETKNYNRTKKISKLKMKLQSITKKQMIQR